MITIYDMGEVPDFKSDGEERAFWETHEFSYALLKEMDDFYKSLLNLPPRNAALKRAKERHDKLIEGD